MDKLLHLIGDPVFREVIDLISSQDATKLAADFETLREIGFNLGLAGADASEISTFDGIVEKRKKLNPLATLSVYLPDFKAAAEKIADDYDDDTPCDPASYFDAGAFIMGLRFMKGKGMDDWENRVFFLEAATSCLELAGSLTPANQPSKRAIRAYWLSTIHEHLFDLMTDPERIAWSIAETERALSVAPDHPESGIWRGALASRLFKQHEESQNKEHLSKALRIIRDMIEHEQTAGMGTTAHHLAISLHKHYERTGDTESLEAATIFAERAAKAAELSWGSPHWGIKSYRYTRLTYINSKSAATPPVNHTVSSICLSRYIRFQDMEDLKKGISVTEQALQSTAEESSRYPALQTSLGRMLLHRYLVTGDSEDLEKAMSSAKLAIEAYNTLMESDPVFTALAAGRGHSQAHKLQGDLYAVKWQLRHYYSEGYGARLHYQIALGWAADDQEHYREQYECLHSLAKHISAEEGHETIGGSTTEVDLLGTLFKLAENRAAPALVRIQSARLALRLLGQRGNWDEASAGAQEALKLLSQICGRFMKREDQQYAIAQTSGLAADACSVALKAGNVQRALEVVEFGRGLILGYLMDARAELGRLRQKHPELAERYETLLERASVPIATGSLGRQEQLLSERVEAVTQLEEMLEQLQRKGFFLQPTPAELQRQAAEGPIVIVNVTDLGSDAIIIAEEEIQAIALPEMTLGQVPSTLRARIGGFRGLDIRGEMAYADRDLATDLDDDATTTTDSGILHWLWSTCVSKVLAKLRAMRVLPSRETRVWWMGTGVASGLPFHAAGRHVPGSTETTLHHCIPSYTPGIKALGYARECASRAVAQSTPTGQTPTTASILVVAMPTTPGYTPLDGVRAETAAIQCLAELPDSKSTSKHRVLRYSVKTLEHPSQEDTLSEMGNHDIIHFACHGMSDPTNPSGSHLLLQRATCGSGEEEGEEGGEDEEGEEDEEDEEEEKENKPTVVDPLTASDISNSNSLGRAWIAYLSACSTAQVRADAFVDENIHLASAFQVAGFAHVIGTLWRADDRACVRLAQYFYTALANMPDMRTTGAVASSLRESVLELRQHFIDTPSLWAPFVHFGA